MAQPGYLTISANHYCVIWGVCRTPQCPTLPDPANGLVAMVGLWCERCWAEWALHHWYGVVPPEFQLRRANLWRESLLLQIAARRGIALDSFFLFSYSTDNNN